jgi:predicted RNase H-like HicB family nuclease
MIKKEYMSAETFSELIEAARQALAYERGARDGYRVTRLAVSKTSQPVSIKRGTSFTRRCSVMRYKGYKGVATLDEDANIFYGEVINAGDVITFQGASLEECRQSFRGSVNEYLEFCRERGEEPDKPF